MMLDSDDLLDSHDVADLLGLASHRAVSTYRGRYAAFPAPVIEKGTGRCVLWLRQDVEAWRNRRSSAEREGNR
jgi:glutathione-regulated potassium-efflux system ancillary protein KefG